jgi:glycosyltransferase involved in cell wall biosynthesis
MSRTENNLQMKLFVLIHALEKGGAEKLLVNYLPKLKRKGVNVELVLLNARLSVPEFLTEITNAGIPIHNLGVKSVYNFDAIFKLRKLLLTNTPDILHVHLFPSLYWAALATRMLKNKPALFYTEHSNHNKRRNKSYLRFIEKNIYASYQQIIAITDSVRQNLSGWIGNDRKITTILNGVDITHIQQTPKTSKKDFCAEFNIKESSNVIFMAASFRYPKDQVTVIKACKQLGHNYHVLLAGEGPLLQQAKDTAQELNMTDQVHFLGFRNDIARIMKSVDLNVLSTDYEGMSGVTLESLASGVPFLGSDVPGITEIVPGKAFLFEKGNAAALAEKIENVLNSEDLYRSMRESALESVKQYDMEIMINAHLKAYNKLLLQ